MDHRFIWAAPGSQPANVAGVAQLAKRFSSNLQHLAVSSPNAFALEKQCRFAISKSALYTCISLASSYMNSTTNQVKRLGTGPREIMLGLDE